MGQGYSFFAVIFLVAKGFVPAWLKNIQKIIVVATVLVKDYINKFVREKYKYFKRLFVRNRKINAPVLLLDRGKLMLHCIC